MSAHPHLLLQMSSMAFTYVCLTIRLRVDEVVFVATEPQTKTSLLPELLEMGFAIFWRVLELIA